MKRGDDANRAKEREACTIGKSFVNLEHGQEREEEER